MILELSDSKHFDEHINILQTAEASSGNIDLHFKHESEEKLIQDLKSFIDWENKYIKDNIENKEELLQILPNFKSLSVDLKVKVFETLLNSEEIVNSVLIINIYTLINPNTNTSTMDVFQDNNIIIGQPNSSDGITEFLDIKVQLKESLQEFYNNISKYFISCITSIHYNQGDVAYDNLMIMPIKYQQLFALLNLKDLSKLSRKATNIETKDLYKIYNAQSIMDNLVYNQYPMISLIDSFQNFIRNNNG